MISKYINFCRRYFFGKQLFGVAAALFAAFMVFASSSVDAAAAEDAVQILLTQKKVIKDKDGKEQKIDADNVLPGDIVEYRAVYRNNSKGRVSGLLADLPIPEGLAFIEGSATPSAGLKAAAVKSPSAASFSALPLMGKDAEGKVVRLPLSDYRVLRWTVGTLAPGAQVVVSARAKVIAPAPLTASARPNAQQAPPRKAASPR